MVPATPLSVPVNANQLNAVDEVCTTALRCTQGDVIGQLLVLVVTGLLAVVLIAAVVHIREARATVSEERSRTATEKQAFDRFARDIARLDVSGAAVQLGPATGATATMAAASAPPDPALERVRGAYEDTLLAMDHYEEEYDESLAEHMSREFGEEVATAVVQGRQLTPSLQGALIDRARDAARDRERLISRLDHEVESLDAADQELSALDETVEEAATQSLVDWSFPELADEWYRLDEVEARLERVVDRRQAALETNGAIHRALDSPSLNAYLYDRLDTRYPVLSDAAAVAGRLQDVRRRVLLTLTNRA